MNKLKNNCKQKLYSNWDKQAQDFWEKISYSLQRKKSIKQREQLEQNWVKQSENYWAELGKFRAITLWLTDKNSEIEC